MRLTTRHEQVFQVFVQRRDRKPAARRRLLKPVGKDLAGGQAGVRMQALCLMLWSRLSARAVALVFRTEMSCRLHVLMEHAHNHQIPFCLAIIDDVLSHGVGA